MPELPEVETMVRGIRPHLLRNVISQVTSCKNKCKPITINPGLAQLKRKMSGQRIEAVRRIGKRVVIDTSNGFSLVIEPRMTGLVLLADPPDAEHLRLRWDLGEPGEFPSFWFWDRRGLGTVTLLKTDQLPVKLGPNVLGPDALEMNPAQWTHSCVKTKREIKVLLLDQKVVSGIGNLYASEILHRAEIHPQAPADSLAPSAIANLTKAVCAVLTKAIENEGSTLGDGTYRNSLNQNGSYQNHHRVYMKSGQSCVRCRVSTIVRIVQAQRSTFFCPNCQKLPRGLKSVRPKLSQSER